jgi:hypothetical protein
VEALASGRDAGVADGHQRTGPDRTAQPNMARFDYRPEAARQLAPMACTWSRATTPTSRLANGCNIINTGFIVTGAGVVVINTGTEPAATASSCAC